jgi:hypothetical protein
MLAHGEKGVKGVLSARRKGKLAVMLAAMLLAATAVLGMPGSQPAFAAPVVHMDDTVVGTGQNIWSGRPIQAEYVTPSSVLIGKQIDTMAIQLKKNGLPTGDAEIGVFGSDLSVKKLFATKDVSTLTASYTSYEFALSGAPYTIQSGDRIGVKYSGGSSTEHISIMRDTDHADPFDGVNSYNSFYNSTSATWSTFALYDLTMTLKLSDDGGAGDTIPPAVTSVSHSPPSPTSSQAVEITATATDNAGLSSVEIFVDGSSIGSCAVSSTSASCVKSGGPYAPDSSHTYSATATDAQGLTGSSAEKTFLVLADGPAPVIHMDDTVVGTGQNIWSGRPAQVEYVTPASSLVGKLINSMTIMLKKSGAPTGTAEIGIINPDLSMKQVFATLDVSTLTASYTSHEFVSPSLYTIAAGDRIGVKYIGGASTEHISIMRDTDHADPFDGVNSYNSFYNSTSATWSTFALYDLTMTLKGTPPVVSDTIPPVITAAPSGGTYNSAQSVVLSSNEPSTIYYTFDGSDPVTSATRLVYSSPIAISASTLLKYYGIDDAGNASAPQEQNYVIQPPSSSPIVHMQDTTATVGSVTYAGRQINAEYVTATSQLVGDKIDSITLRLQKIGSPPGTFQVGIFNADLTAKKSFAIVSASTLSTSFQDYEFKLPSGELYTIAAGDRIGIKYNGGTTANAISVMNDRDPADPFDGNKSYRTRYESFGSFSFWIVSYSEDMYMTLKQTQAGTFSPVTHMSDTTVSFASLVSAPRQLMTEYVTPTSQLVGDKIDSITLRLQKVGAPTGTAQVGIFNTDLSVKKLFATINVATISTTPAEYEFNLPAADPLYTIAPGDRIGIKYVGGSAGAGINVTPDRSAADPFDGTNSYRARYEASWINSTGEDLYMILKQTRE